MSFRDLLATEFSPYGSLSNEQLRLLEQHHKLLEHWNKKINLTRINNLDESVRLHYCESLYLGLALPQGPLRIADIGSGGGFPGIPVAILRPDLTVDLIESHQRKAVFLAEAARDLPNVRVIAKRAQVCDPQYDWMITRAVRPSEVLDLPLAPNAGILMGDAEVSRVEVSRLERVSLRKTPWGENRVIAMFHVERGRGNI